MEVWKDVDHEKIKKGQYKINENGDVKSLSRNKPVILKRLNVWSGYQSYGFTSGHQYIHRLVAKAFIPNPNNYPLVNHKDGNKKNNHVSNLEWCTYSQNNKHAFDLGLNKPVLGSKRHTSTINEECVYLIRFLSDKKGLTPMEISRKINISKDIVYSVKNRKSWTHI